MTYFPAMRSIDVHQYVRETSAWLDIGGDYHFVYGPHQGEALFTRASKHARERGLELEPALAQVVRDYEKYFVSKVLGEPPPDTPEPPAAAAAPKLAAPQTAAPEPKRFFRPDELDQLPRVAWLVKGIVPDTGTVVFYGREGSGKSFLALRLANIIAREKTVVYIPYEDLPILGERQAAHDDYFGCRPAPGLRYMALDMPVLNESGAVDQFTARLTREGIRPSLIVFDTLRAATTGLEENSAKEVGAVIDVLKAIKSALNCAILIVHHMGKESGRGARGSTVITADTDLSFEVEGADFRQAKAQLLLKNHKNKFAAKLADTYVDMIPHGGCLVADFARKRAVISGNNAKVYAVIKNAARPLTYSEIVARSGVNKNSMGTALRWLVKHNKIAKDSKRYHCETK